MKREASSMYLSFFLLFIWIFLRSNCLLAQVSNIGEIRTWKKTDNGLAGKTERAFFSIRVYNPQIIRVRVSLNNRMDEFSYVLTGTGIISRKKFYN